MLKTLRTTLTLVLCTLALVVNAQITSSALSGKVESNGEAIIGASIKAIHEPSGTRYNAITNASGRYSISGMRAGGPYLVEVSYIGFQTKSFKGVQLALGETTVLDVWLNENNELLSEVIVFGDSKSNMQSSRSGAITNIGSEQMMKLPTVSRSLNDVMRLSPQGSSTTNGFAVGGGNYRQSNITIDGAAFNNSFGIGSNLPGGGSPISLDALEEVSVSITPYDVRQSGFNGGAINAVTKSGANKVFGTAYAYLKNNSLYGKKIKDNELNIEKSHNYTYGLSIGGPIIKDKLFFFVNGELENNLSAGPTALASVDGSYGKNNYHRPTAAQMDEISAYLQKEYGYNPGRYQSYNIDVPAHKILARIDWNINDNNKLNVRFTESKRKSNSGASASVSPLNATKIYGGGQNDYGRGTKYALLFESTRYFKETNFTSVAAELNSKLFGGFLNNTLRGTYSYQNEPRSYEGGMFPSVEILEATGGNNRESFTMFGPDIFTVGNLARTKNFVITDEASWNAGNNHFIAGVQYESTKATNGYTQCAAGYYAYDTWEDFVNDAEPRAFGITHGNNANLDPFQAKMTLSNLSLYFQDNKTVSDNLKLSLGLRFEMPIYPELKNNFNSAYNKLQFGTDANGNPIHYATDQLPATMISASPRVGFNWDMSGGKRKYVLRGGTGLFVGRMPFVWLVSAVGNSNCGQISYVRYKGDQNPAPAFHTNVNDMLKDIYGGQYTPSTPVAPSSPTILSKDLEMPATFKASLAFDAVLPGDIKFTLEGIYNKDLNPVVVTNKNTYWDGETIINMLPNGGGTDIRHKMSSYNGKQCYLLENAGEKAYYSSLTAQLSKHFAWGLDLSASYTMSRAKSYTEGIGDQVTSAYSNYRYAINSTNDQETGYATYVAPNRVLLSASYTLKEGKLGSSTFSLIYDGSEEGFMSSYSYTRYSYVFTNNVVGDNNGSANLLYIPASREDLNKWNFQDYTYKENGETKTYAADLQRDDFWAYINQDSYLKNHKGQYAERGGAKMPWHHQIDFKFNQDFNLNVGGSKHTLELGCDIQNVANLLNKNWGGYKQLLSNSLLSYKNGVYNYQRVNGARHLTTYQDYASTRSTYQVMFSIRYKFN